MEEPPAPGGKGRLRTQWAGISLEKKLSLFIAPVFVSVVTAILIARLTGPDDSPTPPTIPTSPPTPITAVDTLYTERVRAICDRDGASEREAKAKATEAQKLLDSGDVSGFFTAVNDGQLEYLNDSKEISGQLRALTPPGHLADVQAQAVTAWGRQIAAEQAFLDDLRRRIPRGLEEVMRFFQEYDNSDARDSEEEKDGHLRTLGGAGCNPTP